MSVKSFNFKLGGGGESITSTDPNMLYCVITINTPDLVAVVIATIAAIVAIGYAASTCDFEYGKPGWCGIMMMALTSLIGILLNIVSSVANYSYQLYAHPYGYVQQTVQYTWNDLALQTKMGFVNPRKITESLCYTQEDCAVVANHEGEMVSLQRNRLTMEKVTHLQDEEGDIIQHNHPYSGSPIKLLIADLTRKIQIPDSDSDEDIGIIDTIAGFKI